MGLMTVTILHSKNAQRDIALAKGNRLRLAAAAFKRDLSQLTAPEGARVLADHIDDMPGDLQSLRVTDAVKAVRAIGEHKTRALRKACGITSSDRYIRDLTARQRQILAEELRYFADRYEALKDGAR